MGDKKQARIVSLQRSLKIARDALERIKDGRRDPEVIAYDALAELFKLEPTQPLQGLVGHEKRPRP